MPGPECRGMTFVIGVFKLEVLIYSISEAKLMSLSTHSFRPCDVVNYYPSTYSLQPRGFGSAILGFRKQHIYGTSNEDGMHIVTVKIKSS